MKPGIVFLLANETETLSIETIGNHKWVPKTILQRAIPITLLFLNILMGIIYRVLLFRLIFLGGSIKKPLGLITILDEGMKTVGYSWLSITGLVRYITEKDMVEVMGPTVCHVTRYVVMLSMLFE